jgi:predicted SPOUT superfamily RNA methylase MTH1
MTVSVLVPSSLIREAEDKREATRKIGYVARAATVFRIDRLTVYPDPDGARRWDEGFVETVLRYAATPPYLRKEVWDKRDELEFAGVLPPLRVRSQTGSGSEGSGSLRQGIVTEVGAGSESVSPSGSLRENRSGRNSSTDPHRDLPSTPRTSIRRSHVTIRALPSPLRGTGRSST